MASGREGLELDRMRERLRVQKRIWKESIRPSPCAQWTRRRSVSMQVEKLEEEDREALLEDGVHSLKVGLGIAERAAGGHSLPEGGGARCGCPCPYCNPSHVERYAICSFFLFPNTPSHTFSSPAKHCRTSH
jgi:hypothetical protein